MLKTFLLVSLITLSGATLAQKNSEDGTQALRDKARSLALKNAIKPEDQSKWTELEQRKMALKKRMTDLRQQGLKAYVAALEKGMSKQMAQLEAEKSVQTEKNTLKASKIKMMERAQAFFKKYPQLKMHARNNKMNKHHPKNHQNMPKHPHR